LDFSVRCYSTAVELPDLSASIACFWCSALFIFIRRPLNPTACDLVFLKAAFFPILFGAFVFTAIIRGIYYSGNE